jgi:hypothetical protein
MRIKNIEEEIERSNFKKLENKISMLNLTLQHEDI